MTLASRSRLCLSGLMMLAAGLHADAIPAKPGLINYRQPDGTTIEIRLIGDEHYHMYVTPEGYPLVENKGTLLFADVADDGLRSTGIAARPMSQLTAAEANVVSAIELDRVKALYNREAAVARPMRAGMKRAPRAAATDDTSRFLSTDFPNKGKQKGLVILVQYSDVSFTLEDPWDYFHRMMNEPGFSTRGATGSARDFFLESSDGQFDPEFDVYGPVTLPETRAYYGDNNDANAWQMVTHACELLKDEIDFSQYDRDDNGYVDNIYVFYAGEGESSSGLTYTVWPHSSNIALIRPNEKYVYNGKIISNYATSNEWEEGNPDGVGTFCHEFSHVMGLPDLYATRYTDSFTPGPWSTLDYGPYNNEGRTPPLYTAFERYCVGWMQPEVLSAQGNYTLPPIGNNKALMIKTDSPDEFYMIENRQQNSWDTYLPNHGMLVWHIDFDQYIWDKNLVNNDEKHQRVDLVEADDIQHINNRDGDCFPGTANVTSFTDDTQPSMKTWAGHRLSLPITDICETPGGFLTFKVLGGYDAPEAPANLRMTATTSRSITLAWDPVEGAADYKVTAVRQGTFLPVKGCDGIATGGATEVTVAGLTPSTAYTCYVVATGAQSESIPAVPVDVVTDLPGFSDRIPVATEAADITPTSFTASWEAVEDATAYLLTVYTKEDGEPFTQICDFTGGVGAMPQGWATNVKSTYSMATYAGNAVPSLRLNSNNDMVETAEYPDGVRTFSFWHRGSGSSSVNNSITVLGKTDGEWSEIQTVPVVNTAGGKTTEITDIPAGCTAMRLTYSATSSASLAIDDIAVGHGAQIANRPLEGYDRTDVGNTTSRRVEGLTHSTDYYYTVEATDGTSATTSSNEIGVRTADNSGIGQIAATEATALSATVTGSSVRIYAAPGVSFTIADPAGRIAATGTTAADGSATLSLAPGLYILTDGTDAVKIIVRN